MLRGFFESARRHTAFERDYLTVLLDIRYGQDPLISFRVIVAARFAMRIASGGGFPRGGGEGPPRDGRQSPQKVCYFLFRRRRPASHVLPWWVHNPVLSVNGTRFCKASKSGRSISHTNKRSDNAPEKCDSTAA